MTLLNIQGVSQSFAGFDIFRSLTARLERGGRVGLVGPNGVGKTSLLRIIAQIESPADGRVNLAQGTRIGYLQQEAMHALGSATDTLLEAMQRIFEPIQAMETRLRQLEHAMAHDPAALDEYGDLLERYEAAGGYDYPTRIEQTLSGLGFTPADYDLPLAHLSGGQKTRALLARLLLEAPDLLILDEPTNHLDIEAVRWLENTLRNWRGTLLIVSHDRYFLDVVADTIWELDREGIESYRGNYSAYVKQRTERREYATKVFEQEHERLSSELEYIKRNIARASTNGMAVGRLRRLSRDLVAIQQLGMIAYLQTRSWSETGVGNVRPMTVIEAEHAIRAIPHPVGRTAALNLNLKATLRSSEIVLRTRQLSIGHAGRLLFRTEDIMLLAGERAALMGGNGTGKTTFLRTLREEIAPLDGQLKFGHGIKMGYFAQAQNTLNPQNSVLDELLRHKPMKPGEARSLLARYLFREDDVFKQVGILSGGERARLALAILALDGANLLLLDEPTNHLDIPAQEALQAVLETFEGTILLVSHDRYLVDRLATQIWSVESGVLSVHKGNYRDFTTTQKAVKA
ncbi:MAG TPA: ABC-F family ATP-binding cassette domain-containing protein [Aggregatilineales bacterium]|nr:ABC-F family ATP-binding cassette domain-containing protein [Aggregatilineales bacterium]